MWYWRQRKRQVNTAYVRCGEEMFKNHKTDNQTNTLVGSKSTFPSVLMSGWRFYLAARVIPLLFFLTLICNSSSSPIIFVFIVYTKYNCSSMILSSSTWTSSKSLFWALSLTSPTLPLPSVCSLWCDQNDPF